MARASDDRVSALARVGLEAARSGGEIKDERRGLIVTKRILSEAFQLEDRLAPVVRSRIPRRVPVGSQEWDVLYRKLMEEELRKVRG